MRQKLDEGYRCLYLDSPPMVAGMRSYLAAAGVNVMSSVENGSLVLSSDQGHLSNGIFDADSMVSQLEAAVNQALSDGYRGLWATGDMTWEFGSKKELSKLLEYEWRLEDLFRRQPCLSGICQYHVDTLPRDAVRAGFLAHQTSFVNDTLSRMNPYYVPQKVYSAAALTLELDGVLEHLCQPRQA